MQTGAIPEIARIPPKFPSQREHLLLELDALRSPALLAAQATSLKLVQPDAASSFVIERVPASAPPDKTMVAAR